MGHRTLKRVPLDFKWPLGRIWKGYINSHRGPRECPECHGAGLNNGTRQIAEDYYDHDGFGVRWSYVHGIAPNGDQATRPPWKIIGECRCWCHDITQDKVQALLGAGHLWDFTRVPLNEQQREDVRKKIAAGGNSWLPYNNGYVPTAAEVNAWSHTGFGHDCLAQKILVETRAKRLGVFGLCLHCKGEGRMKLPRKLKKKWQNWREHEPPTGPGYQLWDTCSEGCPISPVFKTPEKLADWCVDNATIFGNHRTSWLNWYQMFTGRKDPETESQLVCMPSGYIGPQANIPSDS